MIKIIDAEGVSHFIHKKNIAHLETHTKERQMGEVPFWGVVYFQYESPLPLLPRALYLGKKGAKELEEQIEKS